MKTIELTEYEQRTLQCIVNNKNIMMSDLTRRMHSMGIVDQDERQLIIDVLKIDHKLIESKTEPFELGKRGRRALMFCSTEAGKNLIKSIIQGNKKSRKKCG